MYQRPGQAYHEEFVPSTDSENYDGVSVDAYLTGVAEVYQDAPELIKFELSGALIGQLDTDYHRGLAWGAFGLAAAREYQPHLVEDAVQNLPAGSEEDIPSYNSHDRRVTYRDSWYDPYTLGLQIYAEAFRITGGPAMLDKAITMQGSRDKRKKKNLSGDAYLIADAVLRRYEENGTVIHEEDAKKILGMFKDNKFRSIDIFSRLIVAGYDCRTILKKTLDQATKFYDTYTVDHETERGKSRIHYYAFLHYGERRLTHDAQLLAEAGDRRLLDEIIEITDRKQKDLDAKPIAEFARKKPLDYRNEKNATRFVDQAIDVASTHHQLGQVEMAIATIHGAIKRLARDETGDRYLYAQTRESEIGELKETEIERLEAFAKILKDAPEHRSRQIHYGKTFLDMIPPPNPDISSTEAVEELKQVWDSEGSDVYENQDELLQAIVDILGAEYGLKYSGISRRTEDDS